jgi:hypothetical protein
MESIKDGKLKIKSGEFPAFVYPSSKRFDPSNRGQGLLRGEALVRVSEDHPIYTYDTDNDVCKTFRLLFTGASSAATGFCPKGIKKCKAAIHGIREPAPETIAYSAVLVSSLPVVFSASLIILPESL